MKFNGAILKPEDEELYVIIEDSSSERVVVVKDGAMYRRGMSELVQAHSADKLSLSIQLSDDEILSLNPENFGQFFAEYSSLAIYVDLGLIPDEQPMN